MIIKTQITSDKNVLNFFPENKITEGTSLEVIDAKSIRKSPLAEQLFDIGEIKSIIITPDMIAVTKEENAVWEELKPQILAEIMDFISTGKKAVLENFEKSVEVIIAQIEGLINARIKPAIKSDGGDIEFKGFEEGVVYVELKGNCIGCAYAMITLKDGVEKLLKTYIPEVKEVRSIDKETD